MEPQDEEEEEVDIESFCFRATTRRTRRNERENQSPETSVTSVSVAVAARDVLVVCWFVCYFGRNGPCAGTRTRQRGRSAALPTHGTTLAVVAACVRRLLAKKKHTDSGRSARKDGWTPDRLAVGATLTKTRRRCRAYNDDGRHAASEIRSRGIPSSGRHRIAVAHWRSSDNDVSFDQ